MLALVILEGLAVAVLAVLVVGLLRSHGEILRRLHELGAGLYDDELPEHAGGHDHATAGSSAGVTSPLEVTDRPDRKATPTAPTIRTRPGVAEPRVESTPAHDIVGITPWGAATAVGIVGPEHATLVAFLSSGCGTCADFWRAFAEGEARALPGRDTRLVVVTKSPEHESQSAVQALAPDPVTTVMSTAAFEEYAVPVSPYFILVNGPDGRIVGEGAAATWAQVANLMHQAVSDNGLTLDLTTSAPASGARRRARRGENEDRDARAEADLAAAGIGPGHPSLYPDRLPTDEGGDH